MPRQTSETSDATGAISPEPLSDDDITTAQVDRRSFLTRVVAAGSVTMGAALSTACGDDTSDRCDSDVGDSDTGGSADPFGQGADRCDSD